MTMEPKRCDQLEADKFRARRFLQEIPELSLSPVKMLLLIEKIACEFNIVRLTERERNSSGSNE
jgi:hypothetical protein